MFELLQTSVLIDTPFLLAGAAVALLSGVLLLAAFQALMRGRLLLFSVRISVGLAMLAAGVAVWALAFGIQGYRALSREEVAARISITPLSPQRFEAQVTLADGRQQRFDLAGDEIYVDAQILKWKPALNLLGVHTIYQLDRIAGRYQDVAQERNGPRTVQPLALRKPFDLFSLRNRYAVLAPLVDAEYGSATFFPATRPTKIEVRVSTSGLMVREADVPGARWSEGADRRDGRRYGRPC